MARLETLPVTIIGSIKPGSVSINSHYNNVDSIYNGYGYTFSCTLEIIPTVTSDDRITPNQYTCLLYTSDAADE